MRFVICEKFASDVLSACCLGILVCSYALPAFSQGTYPSKPVRFIIPFAPGGYTDILARTLGQRMANTWGQPFIMDNRPGATGNTATGMAARAPADGYTILMVPSSFAINPGLFKEVPYDAVRDFAPISLVASSPYILVVHQSVPVQSVRELIEYTKAHQGQLNYSSSGSGTATHVAAELFKSMAAVRITHIPYKGTGAQLTDLLAGQIQMAFGSIGMLPHVKAGRLKALGVSSAKRSSAFPDLPTVAEAGLPGFDVSSWYGVIAPAGTPKNIVAQLNSEIVRITRLPDVMDGMARSGADPVGNSPHEFAVFIKTELTRWAKVIKETGASVD